MLNTLVTVWLLFMAALITPGANVLLITQLAAGEARSSARHAACGVALGSTVWAACAVLGLHALFFALPAMRLTLQLAGGAYLLYLASRLWLSRDAGTSGSAFVGAGAAFRRGLLTNLTNPKAALFFGSIFAAAMPAHPAPGLQLSVVVLIGTTSLAWHLALAWLFSRTAIRHGYGKARASINRVAALIVGALGVGLLYSIVVDRPT